MMKASIILGFITVILNVKTVRSKEDMIASIVSTIAGTALVLVPIFIEHFS